MISPQMLLIDSLPLDECSHRLLRGPFPLQVHRNARVDLAEKTEPLTHSFQMKAMMSIVAHPCDLGGTPAPTLSAYQCHPMRNPFPKIFQTHFGFSRAVLSLLGHLRA